MTLPVPAGHVTATRLLQQLLHAAGWRPAHLDRYAAAQGIVALEPTRPRRAPGHTPARVELVGDVVGLSTFDSDGAPLEHVSWSWADPANLQRIHDYVTAALADAIEMRGQR